MPGAVQFQQFGFDRTGFQAIDHPDRLFESDVFIIRTMDAQGGRGLGGHPVQRTSPNMFPSFLFQVAAKKEWQYFMSVDAFTVGLSEIAGAIKTDHATDGAGLVQVPLPFKGGNSGRDSKEQGKMTTGRTTHHSNF